MEENVVNLFKLNNVEHYVESELCHMSQNAKARI